MEIDCVRTSGATENGADSAACPEKRAWLDFGLTFENHGLRAKAEIKRSHGR